MLDTYTSYQVTSRQYKYEVTLRRFRVTFVAVEKQ
jgi:hypothetical protein